MSEAHSLRHPIDVPPVFLGYQQELLSSTAPVVLFEKSRRIGITWTAADVGVETAAASREAGGMDVLYIGYNLEMAREFIDDSAFWSKHLAAFAGAVPEIQEYVFTDRDKDGDRAIKAFRIAFASGFEIIALSSRPRSLRGRQGLVIIDEAAFHDDLPQLIKAAMALLMWGGRVLIISTHDGADNPFNELVEDVRAGKKPYELLRTTFRDALDQGLYKRICLVSGKEWSQEAENEWVAEIYAYYGDDAGEELDVVPSAGSGVWLTRALIDACANPHYPVVYLACEQGFELKPDHERRSYVEAWLEDHVAPLLERLDPLADSFAGGDFGRSGDLSVFWPGQIARNSQTLVVPFAIELRNVPFREQEQILFYLLDRLPRFVGGAFDARGLGSALAEYAVQRYGAARIERVMATREWYREHMSHFKARFEDRTIEIPRDDDVRQDLRSVRVDKGVPMVPDNVRTRSARGGWRHGDAAIAGVLLDVASQSDAPPIEFTATGERRAGYGGFEDRPGANEPHHDYDSGFGIARGGNDTTGF